MGRLYFEGLDPTKRVKYSIILAESRMLEYGENVMILDYTIRFTLEGGDDFTGDALFESTYALPEDAHGYLIERASMCSVGINIEDAVLVLKKMASDKILKKAQELMTKMIKTEHTPRNFSFYVKET